MSEKIRQKQLFQVYKQKYVGLGNENTTIEEWQKNIQRDTYNSIVGHSGLLEYVSLGMKSECKRDMKINLIKKMCQQKHRTLDEE
ncbi:hypothetical protein TPHA_0F02000 [Tetrapisispora phaffii CBS 4417]|uniref:Splicing factor subunit n=1 Tax=Tetrapisispora phaffii (strain ATCC 24235 / CBS 4417 / NBRC 1672 / NRRL Y-8282 / UCD 70-5) TaxID=1071381 RepID=G8BVA0_TETPH|nr:hypothetical protein TPHA_0F02000 [Tetrapisispora phaffii CBS 4417]CCE63682.1 hypothetical protein TPHA_0F02000 [Tetrapisispora phaffii CBS 4417]